MSHTALRVIDRFHTMFAFSLAESTNPILTKMHHFRSVVVALKATELMKLSQSHVRICVSNPDTALKLIRLSYLSNSIPFVHEL